MRRSAHRGSSPLEPLVVLFAFLLMTCGGVAAGLCCECVDVARRGWRAVLHRHPHPEPNRVPHTDDTAPVRG